jgi:hypothetical protein
MGFTEKLFISLLSAITGALSAFAFNRFNQNSLRKINVLNKISDGYLTLLSEYEKTCVDYWSCDYTLDNDAELSKKEAYIKVQFLSLQKYNAEFLKHTKKDPFAQQRRLSLLDELYERVTMGDFESTKRRASKLTCTFIMKTIVTLRMNIISSTYD